MRATVFDSSQVLKAKYAYTVMTPMTCQHNERYVPDGLTSSPHPQYTTNEAVDAHVSPWPFQVPPISAQKLQVCFAVLLCGVSF
jgi:hypothetical protein